MPRDVIQNADGSISVRVEALQDLLRGEEDDSLEGEDDDSLEGEEDAEFGADKKKKNLLQQLFGKKDKKKSGSSSSAGKTTTVNITGGGLPPQMDLNSSYYESKMVSGGTSRDSAGTATINIRVQEGFWPERVFFDGSLENTTITKIKFGPDTVFDSDSDGGIDVAIFKANNPIADLLKGVHIPAGLDIVITAEMPGAGVVKVMFAGKKVRRKTC